MIKWPAAGKLVAFCAFLGVIGTGAAEARERLIERVSNSVYDTIDDLWPEPLDVPGLKLDIGLGFGLSPEYKGSDDHETSIVPLVRVQYGRDLVLTGYTLKYSVHYDGPLTVGALARYQSGRQDDTHEALMGLGKVSSTIAVGPFVQYRFKDHVRLFAEMRHALGARQGTRVDFGTRVGVYQSENFGAQAALTATWVSGKHMRTFFGVTPEQSANSALDLPVYEPGSGISEIALSLGSRYHVTPRTSFVSFLEYGRLFGDAKDSPLTEVGSPNQFTGGVGVLFSF